ncbi:DUF4265 domain-containing protein [Methylocaldum gracile subsp. desertum]|uniref:DUF4265 domain-containing protein n=1 Tax=Methylocaldum sp. GT1BW TaxID=3438964 RepID=UPI003DA106C8
MNSGKNKGKPHLVKVVFFLGADQWHGYDTESVWAEKIADNRCRIRNTPFYAKGVSFEDVVFVREKDGSLFFEAISIAAGHSTYRILLDKAIRESDFSKYWSPLEELGCTYEGADRGNMLLLAVDVPPNVDIHKAYELLDKGEKAGIWGFEEGHCGHPI